MPKAKRLSSVGVDLSREAKRRLKWIDWYMANGRNARKTCLHFNISPDTLYRWLRRYDPKDLTSLEDRSPADASQTAELESRASASGPGAA